MLVTSSGKHNVTVWRPSVCMSVPSIFLTTLIDYSVHFSNFIGRAAHTERHSPGGSM